jgi:anthranilate synthase/aminodeoxychorismate synthase-like glutamine amidotransferase
VIVILDNRDSFVHNVEHRLAELRVASRVVPSHATRLDEIGALRPTGLVISPGPQGPDEAGVSTAAIRTFGRHLPVLGICLGHQCIAVAFEVPVRPDARACHGRSSPIAHDGLGLLAGLSSPFPAGRYHALAADEPGPDSEIVVSARLADDPRGLIMGVRHRRLPVEGVQFHPESVLTPDGYAILARFAEQTGAAVDGATIERLRAEARRVLEPTDPDPNRR